MQPLRQATPAGESRSPDPTGGITALVRQAQAGDATAFEALYRAHCDRIHALCLRLCGEAGLAETLTQDAFVRAWRKLSLFDGRSAFATWLYRLAVNVVMEELRSQARRTGRIIAVEDPAAYAVPAHQAPDGAAIDLDRAIAALPAGARLVFVLHDVNGYRHEEIAELTGVSVGTSKSQLHRARRFLREALA